MTPLPVIARRDRPVLAEGVSRISGRPSESDRRVRLRFGMFVGAFGFKRSRMSGLPSIPAGHTPGRRDLIDSPSRPISDGRIPELSIPGSRNQKGDSMNLRPFLSLCIGALWLTVSSLAGVVCMRSAVAQAPTFESGRGPTILVDMGHNSLLNGEQFLSPVDRLRNDGYVVRTFADQISDAVLADVDILVIVGALADRNALRRLGTPEACAPPAENSDACFETMNELVPIAWRRPIPPAFSEAEIDSLEGWVRQGGGLFLVFDIFPFPGAIESLVARFGVEISNGFAVDEALLPENPEVIGPAGELVFRRADGSLADHSVTTGRNSAERIEAIAAIFGSAFRLPSGGQSLFTFGPSSVALLPDVAWQFSATTPRQSIAGWSQGGLLNVGEGRLAIFAESGILQPHRREFDERYPGMQNAELVLNVFHWLSGLFEDSR